MLDLPVILALGVAVVQGAVEWHAMRHTGSAYRKWTPEWTFYAVNVPYWILIGAGIVEHIGNRTRPSLAATIVGVSLATVGIAIRSACHYQLKGGFSPFVELGHDHRLVTSGWYRHIRHPMYLGTLLLFVAFPLILHASVAWCLAAVASVALLVRIAKEEQLLRRKLPGYDEYATSTWCLLPGIW